MYCNILYLNKYKINELGIVSYYIYSFSDLLFKMLLLGDAGVGKSSIILRYTVSDLFNIILGKYVFTEFNEFNWC